MPDVKLPFSPTAGHGSHANILANCLLINCVNDFVVIYETDTGKRVVVASFIFNTDATIFANDMQRIYSSFTFHVVCNETNEIVYSTR